jgi:tetratricopeptide (TPR) repeat protein
MLKRIALLILLLVAAGLAGASAQSWQALYDAGSKAYDQGHYREAIAPLTKALSLAESAGGDNLTDTLDTLADCHYALDAYARSEELHRRVLSITARKNGTTSYEYASALNNLGLDLFKQDKNEESARLLKQALAIYDKDKAGNADELLDVLNTLGRVSSDLDRRGESAAYFKRALSIAEKKDPQGAAVADNLECLADLYAKYDHDKKAVAVLMRAAQLRPADSAELADCLATLGNEQDIIGESEEARSTLRRSLAIYEKLSGKESLDVARVEDTLATVLRDDGDYKGAEALLKSCLAIRTKVSGAQDPDLAATSMKLGLLYKSLARYAEAQVLIVSAEAVDEKVFGPQSKNVADDLSELAQCMVAAGRYELADPVFRRAIAI